MKTIQLLTIGLLLGSRLFSQDTLYTTQGQMIAGKVIEVNQEDIKYKKADNPDGPLYVISKADVVLIEYKNGVKDVFPKTNNSTSASQSNNSSQQQVYVNPRPSVRVVVGAVPFYGGWGWGGNWGYRPNVYHHNYYGGHSHYGGHHGHHR